MLRETSKGNKNLSNKKSGVVAKALSKRVSYRSPLKPPDAFFVSGMCSDRSYRWVSRSYINKCGGYDRRGWEVLTAQNQNGEKIVDEYGQVLRGTSFVYDDLVLAFMTKEKNEIKKAKLAEGVRSLSAASGARLRMASQDPRIRAKSEITSQRDGIVDKY